MKSLKLIPLGTPVNVRFPSTPTESGIVSKYPFIDPDDGVIWYPISYRGMEVNTEARFIVSAKGLNTWTTQVLR